MDALTAVRRHGGVAAFRELMRLVDRTEIERALLAGELIRLRRGVYGLPGTDEAVLRAAGVGGIVSHLSAALWHGWKVKTLPARPVVTVARHRHGIDSDGLDLRWGDVRGLKGVTGPIRTVTDCARTLPFDEGLAVADSALRSGKVRLEQLQAAAAASPRTGRARAVEVASFASAKAANPFESVLRAIALGVPGLVVEPQGEIDE